MRGLVVLSSLGVMCMVHVLWFGIGGNRGIKAIFSLLMVSSLLCAMPLCQVSSYSFLLHVPPVTLDFVLEI